MKGHIVVAVDAMGGDNAPFVEVEGAVAAARHRITSYNVCYTKLLRIFLPSHDLQRADKGLRAGCSAPSSPL